MFTSFDRHFDDKRYIFSAKTHGHTRRYGDTVRALKNS